MLIAHPGALRQVHQTVVRPADQRPREFRAGALDVAPGHALVPDPRRVQVLEQARLCESIGRDRRDQLAPVQSRLRQVLLLTGSRGDEPGELPVGRQHRIAHQRRSTHRVEDRAEQAVDEVGLRRRQRVARCRRQRDHHRSVRAPRVRLVEDLGQQLTPGRGQVVRLVQHECERLGAVQRVDDLPGVRMQPRDR